MSATEGWGQLMNSCTVLTSSTHPRCSVWTTLWCSMWGCSGWLSDGGHQQLCRDAVPFEHSQVGGGGVCSPGEVSRDHGAQKCEILNSLHTVTVYIEGRQVCYVPPKIQDHLLCRQIQCLVPVPDTPPLTPLRVWGEEAEDLGTNEAKEFQVRQGTIMLKAEL